MSDCIFCKIVAGEIPCYKIYEDELFLAFLDNSKDCAGHTLIIPKQHFKDITEMPDNQFIQISSLVQKIATHYIKNCGADGVNILNNSGISAGQTIMHFHYHIYPRKTKDNFKFGVEQIERDFADEVKKLKFH